MFQCLKISEPKYITIKIQIKIGIHMNLIGFKLNVFKQMQTLKVWIELQIVIIMRNLIIMALSFINVCNANLCIKKQHRLQIYFDVIQMIHFMIKSLNNVKVDFNVINHIQIVKNYFNVQSVWIRIVKMGVHQIHIVI